MITFSAALLNSGYTYDQQVGSYIKEEDSGILHTYVNVEGDTWNYEKYDADDNVLSTKSFTI